MRKINFKIHTEIKFHSTMVSLNEQTNNKNKKILDILVFV